MSQTASLTSCGSFETDPHYESCIIHDTKLLANLPQDTIELVRRGGMSLTQVSFLLNGTPCDYDPAANGGDLPSSWSSDNSLSVCSIEPRVPVILEQDFIQAISRTFALPTTDLDCLRGIDADLYLNPLEALFQLGDETSCGHEDIRQFESFLEMDSDDEEEDCDTDSVHSSQTAISADQSFGSTASVTDACSLQQEKQVIRVVLSQATHYDTWKKTKYAPVYSQKRNPFSFSVLKQFGRRLLWHRS